MMNVTTATPTAEQHCRAGRDHRRAPCSCRARSSTSAIARVCQRRILGADDRYLLDRGARDVVQVSGPDALTYLQGQVSQDLRPMAGRRPPLDVPAAADRQGRRAGAGAAHGRRRRSCSTPTPATATPRRPAEPVQDPGQGRRRAAAVAGAGGPRRRGRRRRRRARSVAARRACATARWRSSSGLGSRPAGRRWASRSCPGETIPAETGITDVAVDFKKGCYPGQELVERMDSRGAAAPRRLRVLDVADGARPATRS